MAKRDKPPCSIRDCDRPHEARGYCRLHYRRWQKHGDPLANVPRRTLAGEPREYFEKVVLVYEGHDCLPWPYGKSGDGYGQMMVDGKFRIVSRLVCEREHGAPPSPRHEAAHSCGNGHLACCTKRHISWKTSKENKADKIVHGTRQRGERHGQAKLTEAQVTGIVAMKGRKPHREIADQFGVSRSTVSMIFAGKNWGWLQ